MAGFRAVLIALVACWFSIVAVLGRSNADPGDAILVGATGARPRFAF